ncbi:unnamed protein product, partial [Timema podura]|nr:unnamed protein product [Timema podura]
MFSETITLEQEQEEEEIPIQTLQFYDNKPTVDELMSKPDGLFYLFGRGQPEQQRIRDNHSIVYCESSALDHAVTEPVRATNAASASDAALLAIISVAFLYLSPFYGRRRLVTETLEGDSKNSRLRAIGRHEFTVAHYTGKVTYDTTEMADKNRDFLPPEMIETLRL